MDVSSRVIVGRTLPRATKRALLLLPVLFFALAAVSAAEMDVSVYWRDGAGKYVEAAAMLPGDRDAYVTIKVKKDGGEYAEEAGSYYLIGTVSEPSGGAVVGRMEIRLEKTDETSGSQVYAAAIPPPGLDKEVSFKVKKIFNSSRISPLTYGNIHRNCGRGKGRRNAVNHYVFRTADLEPPKIAGVYFIAPDAVAMEFDKPIAFQSVSPDSFEIKENSVKSVVARDEKTIELLLAAPVEKTIEGVVIGEIFDLTGNCVPEGETFSAAIPVLAARAALKSPGPDPTFKLGEHFVFPSPAKRGRNPALHMECGIADKVYAKIYDIAGDEAHFADITGPPARPPS
ncbi:MAG: hypothetical protein QME32_07825 [Endomicrobiia bacterium]|nr:hypothetical protein [Endomicrobiia bacterium]